MLSMNPAGLATGCTALLRTGAHYYPAIVVVGLSGSNAGQLWRRALFIDSGHGALRAICGPFRVPLAPLIVRGVNGVVNPLWSAPFF